MMNQPYNRLIAIFAALVLVASLGACKNNAGTADSTGENPPTSQPTGGGPNDPSNATEGSGTTTSDPSTQPSQEPPASQPADLNEPTGGGPSGEDINQPTAPTGKPLESLDTPQGTTAPDRADDDDNNVTQPTGGGPADDANQGANDDVDAGSLRNESSDNPAVPTLP